MKIFSRKNLKYLPTPRALNYYYLTISTGILLDTESSITSIIVEIKSRPVDVTKQFANEVTSNEIKRRRSLPADAHREGTNLMYWLYKVDPTR